MYKQDLDLNNLQELICHKTQTESYIYTSTPTFCKLVNINIGKYFFKLIDKHFNQYYKLHKIFNRKTLKISYSCMNNFLKINLDYFLKNQVNN